VDDVSLSVAPGTVCGLLGRNGAGKTTLVKLLATLIEPTDGDAWVGGYSVRREGARVRGVVGLAAGTERGFYFRLTGQQNLRFFGALHGLSPHRVQRHAAAAMEALGLADAANRPFMRYSTGMRRKLDLARALVLDPPVLLLDEPTASVDPTSADQIRAVIAHERGKGKTVLLVTHNLLEAERLCDVVAIMNRGRLAAYGTLAELRRGRTQRTIEVTLSETTGPQVTDLCTRLRGIDGVHSVEQDVSGLRTFSTSAALRDVLRAVAASDVPLRGVVARELTLEEIFRDITGETGDTAVPTNGAEPTADGTSPARGRAGDRAAHADAIPASEGEA
jgi:ABC-2 type transport system ATP-binding protein